MNCVYLWTFIEDIEFPSFKNCYSSSAYTVRIHELMNHLKTCNVKFQNSQLQLEHLQVSKSNDYTHIKGQPLLFHVNPSYLAVLTPTFDERPSHYVAYYSRMRIFYPQQYWIDLDAFTTMDAIINHCIALNEPDNLEPKVLEMTIMKNENLSLQCKTAIFSSTGGKTYWMHAPGKENSLVEAMKSKGIPEEYLILFLNACITNKTQLENLSNAMLIFHCGVPEAVLPITCNLL